MESSHPDIFLSIGTGCTSETKETTTRHTNQSTSAASLAQMMPPTMEPGKSIANKHKLSQHYKAMLNRVDNILDTERAWTDFQLDISRSEPDAKSRYRRLNPVLAHQPPRLDEVEKLRDLQQEVHKKMHKQRGHTKEVAHQLVASSFFFDKFPKSARLDSNVCSGKRTLLFRHQITAHSTQQGKSSVGSKTDRKTFEILGFICVISAYQDLNPILSSRIHIRTAANKNIACPSK